MTTATASPESSPTPKHSLPMRIVPGRLQPPGEELEYDFTMPGGSAGQMHKATNRITIEAPAAGLVIEPLSQFAWQVKQLMQAYWHEEARIDGLLKAVEDMTGELAQVTGERDKAVNQLAFANREIERLKAELAGKGKRKADANV